MKQVSLRCTSALLLVLATSCGGGDFVYKSDGKVHVDAGDDGSMSGMTGSGGTRQGGAGGSPSGDGGSSSSGGSTATGGTAATGGHQGTGATPNGGDGGTDSGSGGAASGGGPDAGSTAGGAAGANGGGASGTAGAGGSDATGGTGNGGNGGAGGSPCTNPTSWYIDNDQDGFGSSAIPAISSCLPPPGHFTKVGGDCDDTNVDVHPQVTADQMQYFTKPYQKPGGVDSFDYDCSGHEEGDPGQAKAEASCPAASLGSCGGSGYLTVATGNRVAANGYCGSRSYRTCVSTLAALCKAQDVTNFSDAYRCK